MSDRRVLLTERHLEDIAEAIREKLASHDTYLPGEMADAILQITGDDPVLEPLTAMRNASYAPGAGVDGFDAVNVAVPTFTASVEADTIVLTGDAVTVEDDTVVIANGSGFIHKNITANGTYQASDDNADGYSGVTVDVEANLGEKSITQNGDYDASVDGLDGYSSISVRVGNMAWVATAIVDSEYPYAEPVGTFALNALTCSAEVEETQNYPYADVLATLDINAFDFASEAQEVE